MEKIRLGVIEARFADLIWSHEPIATRELVKLCEKELEWKRTTTYTVLKRLCDRGIFVAENSVVTSQISRKEFYAIQSEQFVEEAFQGSLPDFFAAFASRKKPTEEEMKALQDLIESWGDQ